MKIQTRTHNLVIIFFCMFFIQTNVCAQKNIIGSYVGQETKRVLTISEENSFLIRNNKNNKVSQQDTLSFGTWKHEDNFIVLNTPERINSNVLKVNVEESVIDSITLKIEITRWVKLKID